VIELAEQDGVALLRMADGKANAMSLELCQALTARFKDLSAAPAIVVAGTGRIFSAGVDLIRLLDGGVPYIREFLPALSAMFAAVFSHPRPVVSAINGHAIAGGCVLACAADKSVMAREAGRIGATELLVGVAFPSIAMEIMRHAMAPQYFEDAILSGATYAPAEALARGLVHEIVDPPALIERAIAAAKARAAISPAAFALTKRQIREAALQSSNRAAIDAAVMELWTAPETLDRIRDYVDRTLRKS
jgi:enoyl-CoA hydratase